MIAARSLAILAGCLLSACAASNREPPIRPDSFRANPEEPDRFWELYHLNADALWIQNFVFWEFLGQKYNRPLHGPTCPTEKTLRDIALAFASPLPSNPVSKRSKSAQAKRKNPSDFNKTFESIQNAVQSRIQRTERSVLKGENAVLKAYEAFGNEVRQQGERMRREHENSSLYKEFDRRMEEFDRRKSPARQLFEELRHFSDQLEKQGRK